MDWKDFFKPSKGKIILFVILFAVINYVWISSMIVLDAKVLMGLPLPFLPKGSFMLSTIDTPPPEVNFSVMNFLLDIVFWYLLSVCIVFVANKIRKK